MVADPKPGVRRAAEGGKVGGTQAISRAFAVLRLFRDRGGDLGTVQVAQELGLTLSTVHRIIRALMFEGYLAQNKDNDRYYLGAGALLLGQAAQRDFGFDVVRNVLHRLADQTGESVNLGMLDGEAAVVVQRVESSQPLRFSQPPGTRVVLHASSMGKALLAFNDEFSEYVSALGDRPPRLTPHTHRTTAGLRADLRRIRERGWSTDDEESMSGVRCVGAPVLDESGKARAAIAVQAPAVRMPDSRFDELGPDLVRAAKEIAGLIPPGHSF